MNNQRLFTGDNESKVQPVIIVGGGISGLSAAYYLAKQGIPSRLIEREPRLGGVIRTDRVEGCLLEAGPDSFVTFKPWALQLIKELGLEGDVIGSNDATRATYIVKHGHLRKMPEGLNLMVPAKVMPMITTRLLGPATKLRMAREWFRKPETIDRDRSVSEFVEAHYGREVVDYLTDPLLAGVYGGNSDEMSIGSVLPRMVEWEAKYGSLSRAARKEVRKSGGPLFTTLKSGLETLIRELVSHTGSLMQVIEGEAEAVEPNRRVRVNGTWLDCSETILACPAWRAANLLPEGELRSLLASIAYTSSKIVALVYNRKDVSHPLNGHGFLVPRRENRHLAACTWLNRKFNYRVPDDKVALRCFVRGEVSEVEREVRELMGISARPIARTEQAWPRAMAQYNVGHAAKVKRIEEMVAQTPGLNLAGNAYKGIGIPDCVRMGKEAAERVHQHAHAGA